MTVNEPKCFKCGAGVTSFQVWNYNIGGKTLILLFCNKCGAVQGTIEEKYD